MTKTTLTPEQQKALLETLQNRFEKNTNRHPGLQWAKVQSKLEANPKKLWSLHEMENTGGEPDVIEHNPTTNQYTFFDCSSESPSGRRSTCYDQEALDSRKLHKPKNSALGMAADIGIEILTEAQYRRLQELGDFDTKTSSWIATPPDIRKLGGALFADKRYNNVFVYHNGAESYYGARGFRGALII
ncbi:DUF4256 domain-containing protein [Candidatus Peregrinibacteria bacterium HGW-Peregrinibacteria-1]|jgi:hypothetical protein|nr:MAG: DUF4256 domain-containing protein [Candidatus Peregrinibacteria bacterium HGW-Peregrinibacteria-1]